MDEPYLTDGLLGTHGHDRERGAGDLRLLAEHPRDELSSGLLTDPRR